MAASRTLTMILRMDTGNYNAGLQQSAAGLLRFQEKTKSDSAAWQQGMMGRHGIIGGNIRHGLAAAGMSGAGGEIGYALTSLQHLGTEGAGAAAGVLLVAQTYEAATKQAEDLVKAQERHTEAVKAGEKFMVSMGQADTTSAGGKYRSRAEELEKESEAARKANKERREGLGLMGTLAVMAESTLSGGFAGTSYVQAGMQDARTAATADKEREKMLAADREEEHYRMVTRVKGAEATAKTAQIEAMAEGTAKRRASLAQKQAEAVRTLAEAQDAKNRSMAQDTTEGNALRDRDEKLAQKNERDAQDAAHMAQQRGLDAQEAREGRKEELGLTLAQNAALKGYGREQADLAAKQAQELQDRLDGGGDVSVMSKRQQVEQEALRQKYREANREVLNGFSDRITMASAASDVEGKRAVEREQLERDMAKQGVAADDRGQNRAQQTAAWQAEDAKGARDAIRNNQNRLAMLTGGKTATQVAVEEFQRQHPNASAADVAGVRGSMLAARGAEVSARPIDAFKARRAELEELRQAGQISPEREQALLRAKMGEVMGGQTGQFFSGGDDRWRAAQSSISQDDGTQKLTLDEMKQMRLDIASLKSEGMKLRG